MGRKSVRRESCGEGAEEGVAVPRSTQNMVPPDAGQDFPPFARFSIVFFILTVKMSPEALPICRPVRRCDFPPGVCCSLPGSSVLFLFICSAGKNPTSWRILGS